MLRGTPLRLVLQWSRLENKVSDEDETTENESQQETSVESESETNTTNDSEEQETSVESESETDIKQDLEEQETPDVVQPTV